MGLNIIGAGFGRTGTHSLKLAIEQLGFAPCHHMYEVRISERQTELWTAISRGGHPDWDAVFDGFPAQVDWPGSCFWRELVAKYPRAKVILTTRDAEGWYASMQETILPASLLGRTLDATEIGRAGSEIIWRLVFEQLFDGRFEDKAHALSVFAAHEAAVRATVPPEQLLVYNTRQGWGPLCDFLGVPVPDTPYPAGNSAADFRARKPYLKDLDFGSKPGR